MALFCLIPTVGDMDSYMMGRFAGPELMTRLWIDTYGCVLSYGCVVGSQTPVASGVMPLPLPTATDAGSAAQVDGTGAAPTAA
jgi:hypothetical protein